MLFYENKIEIEHIRADYNELEKYKNSYIQKTTLYNTFINTMKVFEDGVVEENKIKKEELENNTKIFQAQIYKIDSNLDLLNKILKNIETMGSENIEEKEIEQYNQNYDEIKNNYINNSVCEEKITRNFINGLMDDLAKTLKRMKDEHEEEINKVINENKKTKLVRKESIDIMQDESKTSLKEKNNNGSNNGLKNNNTLLISEESRKVVLPYRIEEVLEIFNDENNNYSSIEEVIEDKFTRDFSDYKVQFASRYNETMKLARDREKYSFIDSVALATEMMKKRFLHPAIISACRNLNELDVYLDCLDKNELEEFKIFNIEYELYPMVLKHNSNKKGSRFK